VLTEKWRYSELKKGCTADQLLYNLQRNEEKLIFSLLETTLSARRLLAEGYQ